MSLVVFDEVELPTDIVYSFEGGPKFNNTIIQSASGYEHVNKNWSDARRTYNLVKVLSLADMALLRAFFHARDGNIRGFRFKDPNDYIATEELLYQTGARTVQLVVNYDDDVNPKTRDIKKVRASPVVTMERNDVNFTGFTLDYDTGIITLTPDSSKTITAITKAANAQITATGHGFSGGDEIFFRSIAGMTEMNSQVGVVQSVVDANNFTVDINSTSYTTYTSGGLAEKYVQSSEELTWTGEFDVPVRFAEDQIVFVRNEPTYVDVSGLTLIEVKV